MKSVGDENQLSTGWLVGIVCVMGIFYSLVSLFIYPGYTTEGGDQVFYIAPLMQKADPELYPRDFLMENPQTGASLFDEFLAPFFLHNTENVFRVLFLFSFLLRTAFFIGLVLIAYAISGKKLIFSLIVPLLFIIGSVGLKMNIALPPTSWFYNLETELHARSFAFSLGTLAIGFFLLEKRIIAYILISITLMAHLLSALPVLLFFGATTFVKNILHEKKYTDAGLFLIPVIAFIILLFMTRGQSGIEMNLLTDIDPEWRSFMELRTEWVFYLTTNLTQTLFLYIPLLLFFLLAVTNKRIPQNILGSLVFLGITVLLLQVISIVGFNGFDIALFAQLQLFRALYWLIIIFSICALFIYYDHVTDPKSSLFEKLVFGTLFVFIPFGGKILLFPAMIGLLILAIGFNLRESKISSKTLTFLLALLAGILFVVAALWHPIAISQLTLLRSFLTSLFNDQLLALGLLIEWIKKPLFILGILLLLMRMSKIPNAFKRKQLSIFIGTFTILSFGLIIANSAKITEHMRPPSQRLNGAMEWISKNVGNDKLIFVTEGLDDFGSRTRNDAGKNVFVTDVEGAQGMFNRQYALEWVKRWDIQKDPILHWDELTKGYKVGFIASRADEEFPGEIEYQDQNYRVTKISN